MTPAYAIELGLTTQKISIKAYKINSLLWKIYNMTLARFSIQDSWERVYFFEKIFLWVNICIKIVLKMLSLVLNNTDFWFSAEKLILWSYTAVKALPTPSQVKLIDKSKFANINLARNSEMFVVHVTTLKVLIIIPIDFFKIF